jgi:hypothetical protein
MAKLRKLVTYTDYRWEETEDLTPEQIEKWKSGDEDLQEEVLDEVEFELSHDKCLEDSDYPELIEDEDGE